MLARARRTESFHGYRDFQAVGSNRTVERAVPENGDLGPTHAEATWAAGGREGSEKKSPGAEARGARETESGLEAHRIAEAVLEPKKRSSEDKNSDRAGVRGPKRRRQRHGKKVVGNYFKMPAMKRKGTDQLAQKNFLMVENNLSVFTD